MPRLRLGLKRALLVLGDIAVFEIALFPALWLRYGTLTKAMWLEHVIPFTLLIFIWVVVFYITGLYDLLIGREPLRLFRTYLEGMVANVAVSVAFFYLIPLFGIAPRTVLFLYFVITLFLGYAWRLLFHHAIAERFSRERVLFIGPAEEVAGLRQLLAASSLGLNFFAAISTTGQPDPHQGIRWIDSQRLKSFEQLIQELQVQTVVLGTKLDAHSGLKDALYRSLFHPISILDRAEIEEITTGRIPLSYVNETWFLHHLNESGKTWYESVKRGADVILALPFGLLTLTLLPLIAAAIKIDSRGPIFYSQQRVGKHGQSIRIWKFRTMHTDAEKNGPQFTASTISDSRVTRIGKFLRQLRIDELPQIWNVLRGDLSFIGPRPERQEFVAPLIERMPFYALRHLTRPGLTGWAQVSFLTPTASLEDNLKKLQYDLFYIKHRSLLLDLAILLKTIGVVLRRQGT